VVRKGRTLPVDEPRSMLVHAVDVQRSWHVTFASTGFEVHTDPASAQADLAVTAGASDLYVLLWNRREPGGSELAGANDVLDLWRESVRIRWS
jgi:predicted lipid carrier protein YhbT